MMGGLVRVLGGYYWSCGDDLILETKVLLVLQQNLLKKNSSKDIRDAISTKKLYMFTNKTSHTLEPILARTRYYIFQNLSLRWFASII
jgi:hypothetical protein